MNEDGPNQNIVPLPPMSEPEPIRDVSSPRSSGEEKASKSNVVEPEREEPGGYTQMVYSSQAKAAAMAPSPQVLLQDEAFYGVKPVWLSKTAESLKTFNHLFGSLLKASGQAENAVAIPLAQLPEEIRNELRDLFLPGQEGPHLELTKDIMSKGLSSMTEAFISGHNRCVRINELRNASFRYELVYGYPDVKWTVEELDLYRRDVNTINSSIFIQGLDPTELVVSAPRADTSPQLLRSLSVGTEQVSGGGRSTLQEHLSPESSAWLAKVVEAQGLTWDEQANLVFSLDRFVATRLKRNPVVQDLANMYIQRKMKSAYLAVKGASLPETPFAVGNRVVFHDYYGKLHYGNVTRAYTGFVYDVMLDSGREVKSIPRTDLDLSFAAMPEVIADDVTMDIMPSVLPPVPVDEVAWEVRYAEAEEAIAPFLETALADAHVPHIADPTPKNYYLFFTEDGVRKEFYFDNRDIGLKFGELYANCGVPAEVLEQHPRVVRETNRCFFLHLGLATGFNPFKLQACFRREARRLRGAAVADLEAQINAAVAAAEAAPNSTPEERLAQQALEEEATRLFLESPTDLFDSVLQEGAMVDMEILTKIWPAELADVRICLVPLYYKRFSSGETLDNIICYTPVNSPSHTADGWTGRDIVMKRLGAHFTWMAAPADTVELHGAEPLIDRFLRNMRNCDSPVIMRDVAIQYDLHV